MLRHVKVPVLFTHHFHQTDPLTGALIGAISDLQVTRVEQLVTASTQPFTYRSFPTTPHSMHSHDPKLFADTFTAWYAALPDAA